MKDLFTGIYTHFATTPHTSFYNAIGGRLHLEEAPAGTAYPYATYNLVVNSYDSSWTSSFEEASIEFELFSDSTGGATQITAMYEKLKSAFDNPNFLIGSSYKLVRFRRTSAELMRLTDAVPNKVVWHYGVNYTVLTRKAK